VASGGCRWSFCSGEGAVPTIQQAAQGGCRGACGAARRLVGGGKVGRQELAVGHPWRTVTPSPALGTAGDPYSRVAPRLRVEVRALRYSVVRQPALACVRA
jgi:hypothetical protein